MTIDMAARIQRWMLTVLEGELRDGRDRPDDPNNPNRRKGRWRKKGPRAAPPTLSTPADPPPPPCLPRPSLRLRSRRKGWARTCTITLVLPVAACTASRPLLLGPRVGRPSSIPTPRAFFPRSLEMLVDG